jgi:hypothetical protein
VSKTVDAAQAAKPKLVRVKLIKDHIHAGEKKKPGDTIEVSEPDRAFLEKREVIEKTTAAADAASAQ